MILDWYSYLLNPLIRRITFQNPLQFQASSSRFKPDNYTLVKSQRPSICNVSNNLIGTGLMGVADAMHAQLTFRRHNKTPSFGGSPVNCLNDINQLDICIDKRHLREDIIMMANLLLVIHSPISGNRDEKCKI